MMIQNFIVILNIGFCLLKNIWASITYESNIFFGKIISQPVYIWSGSILAPLILFIYVGAVKLLQTTYLLWLWVQQRNTLDHAKSRASRTRQWLQDLEQCTKWALLRLPVMQGIISRNHSEKLEQNGNLKLLYIRFYNHHLLYWLLCFEEQQIKGIQTIPIISFYFIFTKW